MVSRKKIYTTVGVEATIYNRAKAEAERDSRSFSVIVERALKKYLGLTEVEQEKETRDAN